MRRAVIWAACAAVLIAVIVFRYISIDAPVRELDGKTAQLELTATDYSRPAPYGRQVKVRLEGVEGVLFYPDELEIKPGDIISGNLRVTRQYRAGSFFKASPRGELALTVRDTPLTLLPAVWRRSIENRILELFPGDGGQLMAGILTGNSSGFSPALNEGLFSSGMTHVASVSGLHITMLVGFVTLVVGNRRRALAVALPLVFVYVAIAGFAPSAVRAAIMCALYLIAPLIGREYSSWRGLVAALLVLLVINPHSIFEPGLQLSFTATLGLVLFSGKWTAALLRRIKKGGAVSRYALSALSSSCAALVFSSPVAAWWFGGVSVLSPLTNFLLLWLVNFIFIGGALAVLFSVIWFPLGAVLAHPVRWALDAYTGALGLTARVPFAVIYTSQPFLVAWLMYLYGLLTAAILSRKWKIPAALALLSLTLCVGLTAARDSRWRLEVSVLDVGQGQCVVLRSGGKTAVVDCGGTGQPGRTAARYLQSKGAGRVDLLLLTHYDDDHISGVGALGEIMPVGEIIGPDLPGAPPGTAVLGQKETLSFGGAEIELIPMGWPGEGNDSCMSVVLTLDGFSLVITGDLSGAGERWLLRAGEMPQNGVIVAGHHGSGYSSSDEWLDGLEPLAVIISSGINTYGHPAPSTLARLFERGIAVYRTDRSGNVIIRVP